MIKKKKKVKEIKKDENEKKILFSSETLGIKGNFSPSLSVNSGNMPIYLSTIYEFDSAEAAEKIFDAAFNAEDTELYSRVGNPNVSGFESMFIHFEKNSKSCLLFRSGLAAIHTVLGTVCPKDKVIAFTTPVYGGTFGLIMDYYKKHLGFETLELDPDQKVAYRQLKALGNKLGVLYIESPVNPTLRHWDIDVLCKIAKKANPTCFTVLDNTLMGIFLEGFVVSKHLDFIVYSATKYISGHCDVLAGIVVCNEKSSVMMKTIKLNRIIFGNILDSFSAYLLTDHLSTYRERMKDLAKRAKRLAIYLNKLNHPKIKEVIHPELLKPGTEQYKIYKKQSPKGGGSGVLCLKLNTDKAGTFRFINALKATGIGILSVSLGGRKTIYCNPNTTTSSEMSKEELDKYEIVESLVRFSIGKEGLKDLIKAIKMALKAI